MHNCSASRSEALNKQSSLQKPLFQEVNSSNLLIWKLNKQNVHRSSQNAASATIKSTTKSSHRNKMTKTIKSKSQTFLRHITKGRADWFDKIGHSINATVTWIGSQSPKNYSAKGQSDPMTMWEIHGAQMWHASSDGRSMERKRENGIGTWSGRGWPTRGEFWWADRRRWQGIPQRRSPWRLNRLSECEKNGEGNAERVTMRSQSVSAEVMVWVVAKERAQERIVGKRGAPGFLAMASPATRRGDDGDRCSLPAPFPSFRVYAGYMLCP